MVCDGDSLEGLVPTQKSWNVGNVHGDPLLLTVSPRSFQQREQLPSKQKKMCWQLGTGLSSWLCALLRMTDFVPLPWAVPGEKSSAGILILRTERWLCRGWSGARGSGPRRRNRSHPEGPNPTQAPQRQQIWCLWERKGHPTSKMGFFCLNYGDLFLLLKVHDMGPKEK